MYVAYITFLLGSAALYHILTKMLTEQQQKEICRDFPGGTVVKNPPANAGDMGSSPGPGGSHMPRSN